MNNQKWYPLTNVTVTFKGVQLCYHHRLGRYIVIAELTNVETDGKLISRQVWTHHYGVLIRGHRFPVIGAQVSAEQASIRHSEYHSAIRLKAPVKVSDYQKEAWVPDSDRALIGMMFSLVPSLITEIKSDRSIPDVKPEVYLKDYRESKAQANA